MAEPPPLALLPSSVSQQQVSMPTGMIQSWNRLVLLMSEIRSKTCTCMIFAYTTNLLEEANRCSEDLVLYN